jgi:hypothetical protein
MKGEAMLRQLFSGNKQDPVDEFWEWFKANETRLWKIDQDTEKVYRMIREALDRVNPGLTFEVAMAVADGRRQFFISDGGNSSYTLQVHDLHRAAPELSRWQIIKHTAAPVAQGAVAMDKPTKTEADVRFQLFNDGDKVGILMMFPNYQEAKRDIFARIAPDLLKEAIGEQGLVNRVGFIDYAGPESNFFPNARPLSELGKALEEYYRIYRK